MKRDYIAAAVTGALEIVDKIAVAHREAEEVLRKIESRHRSRIDIVSSIARIRLRDDSGEYWLVQDIASSSRRRRCPVGPTDARANAREFSPWNHAQKPRRYRFASRGDRPISDEILLRQLASAKPFDPPRQAAQG